MNERRSNGLKRTVAILALPSGLFVLSLPATGSLAFADGSIEDHSEETLKRDLEVQWKR
ncbi:hypothetical protein OKA05_07320 [Luteolibacter arcticus]|uniref:Uncharacterized protein n=1 Tax=Luteolibacter arcticus TaxID=1581411 RepID=A0ABT3GFG4_9BACT|nr:hypothetical protein [Luteolibacter arcticus]MCW1922358.1 hypothetical protein [Luteolibacter arcticus]